MADLYSSNSTTDGSSSLVRGTRPTRSKKVPAKYHQELEEEDNTILTFEELDALWSLFGCMVCLSFRVYGLCLDVYGLYLER